ncbi:hypothetical protein TNIN_147511 [Trichonephila inaurata madagascariensis]|uniref:Uncharacterized protein n=1 Tax=Trichonephila inaurata madagascariensis TaxID=2747483 RepID=A0A8X6XHV1_9ARAC|nr:hypothetical protein TNIN_147511 [Trichonephila inaurata madagascariensis]
MVLHKMGETIDSDLGILELKQKLLSCKVYLEDEEFVCDFLDTMIEDRMEKEYRKKEEYRKEKEDYRKRAEECRLERKQELESARIEARYKGEMETRLKAGEEAKAVEERRKKK